MAERALKIAVLAGDGIGPEVMDQTLRLLKQIELHLAGIRFAFSDYSVGAGEYLAHGDPLPQQALEACRTSDAVLLGAMGLPDVRYPDGKEMAPQLDLREQLELYAGVRPIRLYHEADTPLKKYRAGEIDLVLIRESTEGLFAGRSAGLEPDADEACNLLRITRTGARRICHYAFQVARKRRKHVTLVDKSNVLSSMVFFRQIFDEVAQAFPDCTAERLYIDATALYLVQNPGRFDVLVTENMFGDILSDLSAGLVGGMGMAPSGDIGEQAAVFQPAHGSAPDIAGQGKANPIAMILSAAMMLDWFDHAETRMAARALQTAVQDVLNDPAKRTPDMGGRLTTQEMTEHVAASLEEALASMQEVSG